MQFFIPLLAFLLCLAATPVVREIAKRKGWVAYPSKQRWHKQPTALLGGVAIYLGIASALFFLADLEFENPGVRSQNSDAWIRIFTSTISVQQG